jgi:copper transport protein
VRFRLAIIVAASVFWAGVAFAHASLVLSDPADGSVLSDVPPHLSLTFNEPVSPVALKLLIPSGDAIPLTNLQLHGETVTAETPPKLQKGTYALSWRVISADGHPVGGTFQFAVGVEFKNISSQPQSTYSVRNLLIWLTRWVWLSALFVGIGGCVFAAFIARGANRTVKYSLILAIIAAPAAFVLQGLDTLDGPLSAFGRAEVWLAAFNTSLSSAILSGLAAIIFAAFSLNMHGRSAKIFAAIALLFLSASFALTGHQATSNGVSGRAIVMLHVSMATLWIGSILPLLNLLCRRHHQAIIALDTFSDIILVILPLVLGAGSILTVFQFEGTIAAWQTSYFQVFMLKMAFVICLLSLGAWNRWRYVPDLRARNLGATRRLVHALRIEFAVAILVLGVVSLWRFTPPPHSLSAMANHKAVSIHIHTDRAMADISIAPPRAGPVSIKIGLLSGEFTPLTAKNVTFSLSNPDAGIEPLEREAHLNQEGVWVVDTLTIPTSGRWKVEAAVLIDNFTLVRLSDYILILEH